MLHVLVSGQFSVFLCSCCHMSLEHSFYDVTSPVLLGILTIQYMGTSLSCLLLQKRLSTVTPKYHYLSVADLEEKPALPPPPYFWLKKEKKSQKKEKPAEQAKHRPLPSLPPPPAPSSRSGSAFACFLKSL